ncbi:hypothetical protein, partial [Burkholderia cenocepacia]|uniref:hypothetical protein n=1 Tax=Burkholderia cenocepacia TaxID=95486 RepID=UPI001C0B29EB
LELVQELRDVGLVRHGWIFRFGRRTMRRIRDGGILPHHGEQPAPIARRNRGPAPSTLSQSFGCDARALWSNTGFSTKP